MERIKSIKGTIINALTRDELDKELIAKGDWGIAYYVPGRNLNQYCISINKIKYRTEKLKTFEELCKNYNNKELKEMSENDITKAIEKIIYEF